MQQMCMYYVSGVHNFQHGCRLQRGPQGTRREDRHCSLIDDGNLYKDNGFNVWQTAASRVEVPGLLGSGSHI
jgi:hypothetical protein